MISSTGCPSSTSFAFRAATISSWKGGRIHRFINQRIHRFFGFIVVFAGSMHRTNSTTLPSLDRRRQEARSILSITASDVAKERLEGPQSPPSEWNEKSLKVRPALKTASDPGDWINAGVRPLGSRLIGRHFKLALASKNKTLVDGRLPSRSSTGD